MGQKRDTTDDWGAFYARFRDAVRQAPQGEIVWQVMVNDRCYQQELDRAARWVLRTTAFRQEWLEDLKDEALLVLERELRRSPNLWADVERLRGSFRSWMRCILRRDCLQALRRLERLSRTHKPLPQCLEVADPTGAVEMAIDLQTCIARLANDRQVSVVLLWVQGFAPDEIAKHLGLTSRQT